jgi:hypothetical protein
MRAVIEAMNDTSLILMTDHLTRGAIARLRSREAGARDLVRWADHLASCEACRALAGESAIAHDLAAQLTATAGDDEPLHLDFETLARLADGTADANDEELARTHNATCTRCREDLADLQRFARVMRRRPAFRRFLPIAAAAAAAIAVTFIAPLIVWNRSGRTVIAPQHPMLHVPPLALRLRDETRSLRGRRALDGSLQALAPIGRIVLEDRPAFEWATMPDAEYYRVDVFDEQFHPVATSARIRGGRWIPPTPLPEGRVLLWQVTALARGETVTSPQPPMSEARFYVLERDRAAALHRLELRRRPDLTLGIAYANAGALDEAQHELSAAVAERRDAEQARAYLRQLQQLAP